jgi:hypothetical protein
MVLIKNQLIAGISTPNSDLKSRTNAIFIQDTLLLTKSTVLKAGRQGYPKPISQAWGWPLRQL